MASFKKSKKLTRKTKKGKKIKKVVERNVVDKKVKEVSNLKVIIQIYLLV